MQESIEQGFRFKILYLFCISEDGEIVERGYKIPEKEVIYRGGTTIRKNPKHKSGTPIHGWYEQYHMIDEEEFKEINDIWKKLNKK